MNTFFDGTDNLQSLSSLLETPKGNQPSKSIAFTPGSIGPAYKKAPFNKNKITNKDSGDIWDEEEVQEVVEDIDPRIQPEYELKYVQKVTSEDMYLGMSAKTPSIGHSDEFAVTIKLPKTTVNQIETIVTKTTLEVLTPVYRVKIHLPREVYEDKGSAKWESDTETLRMKLVINGSVLF